ncbi:MAG: TonB-dependent receptor [Gammaproteobacteria bacterium]|nr:TonB-dependent receptor [Gammaproteobacteria bacterium]MYD02996.1 TonB-dependent receptor [Gammaproteobacteria bacterium]MYI25619.1 TonB-dependent receptor [Gammaproteobacteria bacterium]
MRAYCLLFSLLISAPAAAQQQEVQTEGAYGPVLEEIIVTATRRERSVMEVPLAVSAYGAEQLELSGVTDIGHLMRIAPSLHLGTGQAETVGATARIRGIGTNSDNPGFEPAVGLYVDGVYRNRAGVGYNELGAIERVEILRGPQGTLFGRNASAGVVSIITAGPDPEGSGYGDISFGSYDSTRIEAGASGSDSASGISARLDTVWHKRDGFLEDPNYDRSYNDRDRLFVRGQLIYEPNAGTSIRLIADHTTRDEQCCAAVGLVRGPTAAIIQGISAAQTRNPAIVGIAFDPYERKATVSAGSGYHQGMDETGVSVEINASTGLGRVTSITAIRDWRTERGMDIDFSVVDVGERPQGESTTGFETFTQEIRINGEAGPVDWLVGAFYADEKLDYTDVLEFGAGYSPYANAIGGATAAAVGAGFAQLGAAAPALEAGAAQAAAGAAGFAAGLAPFLPPGFAVPQLTANLPPFPAFPFHPWASYEEYSGRAFFGNGSRDNFEQNSESWALFTHNSVALANDFELTVGLRYTSESKSIDAGLKSSDQVCQPFSGRVLGYLQSMQAYLGGVQAYAGGVNQYLQELDGFVQQATQAITNPALQAQITQGAEQVKAGAQQLLPGAAQLAQGGQALLTNPDVAAGIGTMTAFACLPFVDPTLDGIYSGSRDESEISGTVRLSRQVGDYLIYGGYARGYKAGGFNMDRTGLISPILTLLATGTANVPGVHEWAFDPETVDAFDLGARFELENRRAMMDINLFYEKFDDFQLTAFTGLAFEALNIPEVISQGIEIEARGAVFEGVEVFGGVTYADVKYGEGLEYGVRSGQQMTHAPEWTGVAGATLRFPIGALEGAFHVDARYTSEHNTGSDLDIEKQQDAFTVVNARLMLSRPGSPRWTVDLWARNLLDEEYFVTAFDAPLQGSGTGPGSTQTFNAFLGNPREYGVSVRYEF